MEDDILIDNYLKGILSKDDEKSFLERLKSDIEFNEKFKLEKQLFNALSENSWSFSEDKNSEVKEYVKLLKDSDLQNLKKTLGDTNSEFNSKQSKNNKQLFYYLVAASIVIFLGFQFFFNQTISNQDLYNDYVAITDLPSFVSRNDGNNELSNAQSLFEEGKYSDALFIFQDLNQQSENEGTLLIYKGIAQSELEKFDEAEKTFNTLINSNLLDAEKGYWYKALMFVKNDRVEDAKNLLKEIASKSLYNKAKAEELLSDLDN